MNIPENAYAVIPLDMVRKKMPGQSKELYCLISFLTFTKGFCDAKNETLASTLGYDKRTIIRALKVLEDLEYIQVKHEARQRKIYLPIFTTFKNARNVDNSEFFSEGCQNCHPRGDKTVTPQLINNTINKIDLLNNNNKNIISGARTREELIDEAVQGIIRRNVEKYPGYDPVRYALKPFGVWLNRIIFTLAKARYTTDYIGISLAGVVTSIFNLQCLIDIFDIALVGNLAHYLEENNESIVEIEVYILKSIIASHKQRLKEYKATLHASESDLKEIDERLDVYLKKRGGKNGKN